MQIKSFFLLNADFGVTGTLPDNNKLQACAQTLPYFNTASCALQ